MCLLHRTKCGCCLTTLVEWMEPCGKFQLSKSNLDSLPKDRFCRGYEYAPAFLDDACDVCVKEAIARVNTQTEADATAADAAWARLAVEGPVAEQRRNETDSQRAERESWERAVVEAEYNAKKKAEADREEARKKREEEEELEWEERDRLRAERKAKVGSRRVT